MFFKNKLNAQVPKYGFVNTYTFNFETRPNREIKRLRDQEFLYPGSSPAEELAHVSGNHPEISPKLKVILTQRRLSGN